MKAAVISLGSVSSRMIEEELKNYFDQVDSLNLQEIEVSLGGREPEVLYEGKPLGKYDMIYARGSYRYANLLRSITLLLGKQTYISIRAKTFTIGHDKMLTHLKLQESNIPQPKTWLVSTVHAAKKIIKKITYPVVIKLPGGTHGKGVMLADSPESASSMIDALSLLKQPCILQEYIETNGTDLRALVVGDKVVACMKRTASSGEKRANVHIGGKGSKHLLDGKSKQVAIAAAKGCGAEVCAVDILPSPRGPLVLEINLSPGLQAITRATGVNCAEVIAKFLAENTKEKRETGAKQVMSEILTEQEIHANLDFRGERILIPKLATMASKFKENEEVVIKAKKGKIVISED